jgi:hypothetical protein
MEKKQKEVKVRRNEGRGRRGMRSFFLEKKMILFEREKRKDKES